MNFTAALALADAAVSGMVDEVVFRAVAMGPVNRDVNAAARAEDPDRPSFEFMGTLDQEPSISSMTAANRFSPAEQSSRSVATICATALVTAFPWLPKKGDQLLVGTVVYSVATAPDRDGTDRAAFWLNRVA